MAGTQSSQPIRFIVKGHKDRVGFVDVNMSGTNVSQALREYRQFKNTFLDADPRLKNRWPESVWKAIEEGRVGVGMTSAQARMSWGPPEDINVTTTKYGASEQWVYRGGKEFLYLEDGKVTAIQD